MIKYFCDVCEKQISPSGSYIFHSAQGPEGPVEYRFCEDDGVKLTEYVESLKPQAS